MADRLHNASKVNVEQNLEECAVIAVLLIYNQLLSAIDVFTSLMYGKTDTRLLTGLWTGLAIYRKAAENCT